MSRLRDLAFGNRNPPPERRPVVRCDAARLLANADFIALYQDEGSPVAIRIRDLEAAVRDVSIDDLPKIMALKGELQGFAFVRKALSQLAEAQANDGITAVAAVANRGLLPVKPS